MSMGLREKVGDQCCRKMSAILFGSVWMSLVLGSWMALREMEVPGWIF
jgi:hypothetical protein